ncbi:DUF1848 domain-containing protein [Isachenkonia alkalipeptolytica]|uniref:DUF1848 domain-containing protein n=1 Tax=Isachenkonia alkalipeptolytica TaxID=2565777 RepID=A0AA43XM61_9CLOT|nr:DUF1848 domain-containing protein [Isachenkonia alkalipeptolytica]NBG88490.1 DUF1848 domain-containing protein [Isachenkonia alkalipeptolytica]
MILSVSRRTDIPAFYFDWFVKRIQKGSLMVKNPMNPKQIYKVSTKPDVVDAIVFWTKNPKPAIEKIDYLQPYPYYFQYTLNPYDETFEKNVPVLEERLKTFKQLSDCIGPERVVWRYDPIIFTESRGVDYHIASFTMLAEILRYYTDTVMVSFLDDYRKIRGNMETLEVRAPRFHEVDTLMEAMVKIAERNKLNIRSCAEKRVLIPQGLFPGSCIDPNRIERLIEKKIIKRKDKNQRPNCECIESIDVGSYDSCLHKCTYCYANCRSEIIEGQYKNHDPDSPLLIGKVAKGDVVRARKTESLIIKNRQLSLFDD